MQNSKNFIETFQITSLVFNMVHLLNIDRVSIFQFQQCYIIIWKWFLMFITANEAYLSWNRHWFSCPAIPNICCNINCVIVAIRQRDQTQSDRWLTATEAPSQHFTFLIQYKLVVFHPSSWITKGKHFTFTNRVYFQNRQWRVWFLSLG